MLMNIGAEAAALEAQAAHHRRLEDRRTDRLRARRQRLHRRRRRPMAARRPRHHQIRPPTSKRSPPRVPDSGGVYLVPAFAGLGAPHWDQYARGTITGITRGTTAAHFARAALEGIAFQVADMLEVMKQDSGIPMNELRVDGGASANNLLMQFQADISACPVVRPKVTETTALGAAYLAGLAIGFWKDRAEVTAPGRSTAPSSRR